LFTGEQQNNFEPFGPAWNITHIQLDTASTIYVLPRIVACEKRAAADRRHSRHHLPRKGQKSAFHASIAPWHCQAFQLENSRGYGALRVQKNVFEMSKEYGLLPHLTLVAKYPIWY